MSDLGLLDHLKDELSDLKDAVVDAVETFKDVASDVVDTIKSYVDPSSPSEDPVVVEPPPVSEGPVVVEPPPVSEGPVVVEPPPASEGPVVTEKSLLISLKSELNTYQSLDNEDLVELGRKISTSNEQLIERQAFHQLYEEELEIIKDKLKVEEDELKDLHHEIENLYHSMDINNDECLDTLLLATDQLLSNNVIDETDLDKLEEERDELQSELCTLNAEYESHKKEFERKYSNVKIEVQYPQESSESLKKLLSIVSSKLKPVAMTGEDVESKIATLQKLPFGKVDDHPSDEDPIVVDTSPVSEDPVGC